MIKGKRREEKRIEEKRREEKGDVPARAACVCLMDFNRLRRLGVTAPNG